MGRWVRDDELVFVFMLPQPLVPEFLSPDPQAAVATTSSVGTVPPSKHASRRFFRSNLLKTALECEGDVSADDEFPLELLLIIPCVAELLLLLLILLIMLLPITLALELLLILLLLLLPMRPVPILPPLLLPLLPLELPTYERL